MSFEFYNDSKPLGYTEEVNYRNGIAGQIADIILDIGDIATLNTDVKTSLVAALNLVNSYTGSLTNLTTTAKDNIVNALNELKTNINDIVAGSVTDGSITDLKLDPNGIRTTVANILTNIGTLSELPTTDKTSLVNSLKEINADLVDITLQLTKIGGETDYTNAFQRALDSMDSVLGGVINIPQGQTINFTTATITKQNVKITGSGTLTGKIIINCTDNNICNVSIDGVRFTTTGNAIEIQKGRRFRISNCVFENNDKAIYINPSSLLTFHQIAMANIYHNEFIDVNHALYVDKDVSVEDYRFQVNDFIFTGNTLNKALISHIYIKEIDGIIITKNVCFFPSYNLADTTKQYNIYIKNADWVTIAHNHLFEAGFESIYLDDVKHAKITENEISWCGQRQPSSAIKLTYSGAGSGIANTLVAMASVKGNTISHATSHGIELNNIAFSDCLDNSIECSLVNDVYYYGVTDLSTISHYGTYITGTNSQKIKVQNVCTNVFETNKYINDMPMHKIDVTDTRTTLDSYVSLQFILAQSSPTTITTISGGYSGKRVKVTALNANTTLQHGSSLLLQNSKNVKIPSNGIMEFEYYSGSWREAYRNFPAEPANPSLDVTDTRTTLDATSVINFNMVQSTTTTITSITGGTNYQEITLLAFNGNTTLQYNASSLYLKGGVNATIPSGGLIRLRYYSSKWTEMCRNF